eukprot:3628638-Amphidinium_carterae.1
MRPGVICQRSSVIAEDPVQTTHLHLCLQPSQLGVKVLSSCILGVLWAWYEDASALQSKPKVDIESFDDSFTFCKLFTWPLVHALKGAHHHELPVLDGEHAAGVHYRSDTCRDSTGRQNASFPCD